MTTSPSIVIATVAALLVYSFGRVMRSPLRRWRRRESTLLRTRGWAASVGLDSSGLRERTPLRAGQCGADSAITRQGPTFRSRLDSRNQAMTGSKELKSKMDPIFLS